MKFEMLDGCNRNKLFTAIANQNLFYLWRVTGGDPFDCILAYLYIFVIQLANSTINTISSAQDDAKREIPFRSQRSIAFVRLFEEYSSHESTDQVPKPSWNLRLVRKKNFKRSRRAFATSKPAISAEIFLPASAAATAVTAATKSATAAYATYGSHNRTYGFN